MFETEGVSLKNNSVPTTSVFVWDKVVVRCSIPAEVTMVAAHKGTSSAPKAQCGLKRADSTHFMSVTNILAKVGSRKYLYK